MSCLKIYRSCSGERGNFVQDAADQNERVCREVIKEFRIRCSVDDYMYGAAVDAENDRDRPRHRQSPAEHGEGSGYGDILMEPTAPLTMEERRAVQADHRYEKAFQRIRLISPDRSWSLQTEYMCCGRQVYLLEEGGLSEGLFQVIVGKSQWIWKGQVMNRLNGESKRIIDETRQLL